MSNYMVILKTSVYVNCYSLYIFKTSDSIKKMILQNVTLL